MSGRDGGRLGGGAAEEERVAGGRCDSLWAKAARRVRGRPRTQLRRDDMWPPAPGN